MLLLNKSLVSWFAYLFACLACAWPLPAEFIGRSFPYRWGYPTVVQFSDSPADSTTSGPESERNGHYGEVISYEYRSGSRDGRTEKPDISIRYGSVKRICSIVVLVCSFAENSDGVRENIHRQATEENLPNMFSEFANRLEHDGVASGMHEQTAHRLGHASADEQDMEFPRFPSHGLMRSMNRALLRQMFGVPTARVKNHYRPYWRWNSLQHTDVEGRPHHTHRIGYQRERKHHCGAVREHGPVI